MKSVISYKTNHYLAKFLKNHLTLGRIRKNIPPTMVQEEGRWNPSPEFLICSRTMALDMLQYFEEILPSQESL